MGSTGQLKLKGVLDLFFHLPNHMASVLELLTEFQTRHNFELA